MSRKKNASARVYGSPVEGRIEAVSSFHSLVVYGDIALRELAIVCIKKAMSTIVDACIMKVKPSIAVDFIDDVAWKIKFKGA